MFFLALPPKETPTVYGANPRVARSSRIGGGFEEEHDEYKEHEGKTWRESKGKHSIG